MRRGSVNWQFEILISLVLLAVFAYASYTFIAVNADGSSFFGRYYAADLATSSEIVNAAYGDVLLRYDNIRHDLDLGFWPSNGRIAVGKPMLGQEPADAAVGAYGRADRYPVGKPIIDPSYLVLRKVGASFGITGIETTLESCPTVATRAVPLKDAAVHLSFAGSMTQADASRAAQAFREVLKGSNISIADDPPDATITIRVTTSAGPSNAIMIRPAGADAISIACDYAQQLGTLALVDFMRQVPPPAGNDFVADITVVTTSDVLLRPEQLGQAAAYAIVRYY